MYVRVVFLKPSPYILRDKRIKRVNRASRFLHIHESCVVIIISRSDSRSHVFYRIVISREITMPPGTNVASGHSGCRHLFEMSFFRMRPISVIYILHRWRWSVPAYRFSHSSDLSPWLLSWRKFKTAYRIVRNGSGYFDRSISRTQFCWNSCAQNVLLQSIADTWYFPCVTIYIYICSKQYI